MESMMITTAEGQKLRAQIAQVMSALAVPVETATGEAPVLRDDGVLEFYKNWRVRGEAADSGLFATYSDRDDVIEFGLTERDGESTRNVLLATLVLDDDGGELYVSSDANAEMNTRPVVIISPEEPREIDLLVEALNYFVDVFKGGVL